MTILISSNSYDNIYLSFQNYLKSNSPIENLINNNFILKINSFSNRHFSFSVFLN